MKFKQVIGAAGFVAAAAVSGTASAAWDYSADPFTPGAGELLLAVWDENTNNQVSVWQDLGSSYQLFVDNLGNTSFTMSFNLDAAAFAALGSSNPADLRFAIVAFDNSFFSPAQGMLATTNNASPSAPEAQVQNALNIASGILAPTVNKNSDFTLNDSLVGLPGAGEYAGDPSVLGRMLKESQFFDISANVDETLGFWQFLNNGASAKAAGFWSIDLASNSLTYSAVPIPAAGWLLGSALAGFAAIARRRRAA